MEIAGTRSHLLSDRPLLVLSTGGPAGLWQAGLLNEIIKERNVVKDGFQFLGGSAGAVNVWVLSRYVAQAIRNSRLKGNNDPDSELRLLMMKQSLSSVWTDAIFPLMGNQSPTVSIFKFVFNKGYIMNTATLYNGVVKHLSFIDGDIIEGRSRELKEIGFFGTVAHDSNSGDTVMSMCADESFRLVTEGSAAIPLIFKPVNLSQRRLVDVGVTDPLLVFVANVMAARSGIDKSKLIFIVAQEQGLNKKIFKDNWAGRSIADNAIWLKDTVFEALVKSHLAAVELLGAGLVQLDSDVVISFNPSLITKENVLRAARLDSQKTLFALAERFPVT